MFVVPYVNLPITVAELEAKARQWYDNQDGVIATNKDAGIQLFDELPPRAHHGVIQAYVEALATAGVHMTEIGDANASRR